MVDRVASLQGGVAVAGSSEELELVQQAARGDRQACARLIDQLLDPVRRVVSYLAGREQDVEDLAQMALVEILRSVGSYRGDCPLKYWADRIGVRTALRELRRRRLFFWRRQELGELESKESGADEEVDARGLRLRIAALLAKVSPERRAVLVLHHVEGYDLAEIAAMTGVKLNTVRDRLRRGRKLLRKRVLSDPFLREWVDRTDRGKP
jgi:RNA polymerase sigma-70 factor, ECF subfamily